MTAMAKAFAQSPPPQSVLPNQSPQDLVNALHSAFGEHHARAVHAKGILAVGSFEPSKVAKSLTKATVFAGGTLPVIVRFSDFTGIPDIPDTSGSANPRGLAVKVKGPSGEDFDIVTHSFNGFPTATSDEFAAFLRSIGASGADAPHPTPLERFLDSHPIAKAFLASQKPPPVSYSTTAYFGVNALKFTNDLGEASFVRYRLVPLSGEHYLEEAKLKKKAPNYLQEEIGKRLAEGPIRFDWFAQIADAQDKIDNPSIAWPESRRLIKLGTITVKALATNEIAPDAQTTYLPGQPHSGIEPADPMLVLRNKAYPISFKARK
jgi:catalase